MDGKSSLIERTLSIAVATLIPGAIGGLLSNLLTKLLLEQVGGASALAQFAAMGVGTVAFVGIALVTADRYDKLFSYGTAADGSAERKAYNALRTSLGRGGSIGARYTESVERVLGRVDRFFGDGGPDAAHQTLPGMRTAAPLWTVPSYDRCLLLALVYPVLTILLIWMFSNHVGPAERALGLDETAAGQAWRRYLAVAATGLATLSFWRFAATSGLRSIIALIVAFAVALAGLLAGGGTVAVAVAVAVVIALAGGVAEAVVVVGIVAVAVAVAYAVAFAFFFALAGPFVGICSFAVAVAASRIPKQWMPLFCTMFTLAAMSIGLGLPLWVGGDESWVTSGPLLFFVSLMALVNAPFDWLTLGFTRALLRIGIERKGWWPLIMGIVDLTVAVVVIVALAVAVLWAAQAFAHMTRLGGGEVVIEARTVLAGLADPTQRGEPENWWLYVMLFSTLVPSIVNVAIGALSVLRGVPGLNTLVYRQMKTGGAGVLSANRPWMVLAMVVQVVICGVAGLAVMIGTIALILFWLLPLLGLSLIDWLTWLAAADVPAALLSGMGLK